MITLIGKIVPYFSAASAECGLHRNYHRNLCVTWRVPVMSAGDEWEEMSARDGREVIAIEFHCSGDKHGGLCK